MRHSPIYESPAVERPRCVDCGTDWPCEAAIWRDLARQAVRSLEWSIARLTAVYHESPNADYVTTGRRVIHEIEEKERA
jgi:hypothetical protein